METVILWIHPVTQVVAAAMGLVALWQGWKRVQMLRGVKVIFPWKQHVRWGTWALLLWTSGALGFYVTHTVFGDTHITGLHAELAWPIIGLSLFGLITGYIMDKYKKKRFWLSGAHGLANLALVALVVLECITGVDLYKTFL